ncbi:hypothetical protein DENSPDRAFT_844516 [Dentipellis sp. KUC8613]|nr:hypothetical protein DENSPDRAFT_844516 [Dentipellis sp. KUC8613]
MDTITLSEFNPSGLSILPFELLLSILVLLDFRDLLHCSEVCRHLNTLVKHTVELQYIVELAVDGMSDGPPSDLSASDRLQLLLERREMRHTLSQGQSRVILPEIWAIFDYQHRALTRAIPSDDEVESIESIQVTFPATNGQPERLIVIDNFDVGPVIGFVVDPVLDLVVLLTSNAGQMSEETLYLSLHLRTLGSFAKDAHPDCRDPVIRASLSDTYQLPLDMWAIRIRLTDDNVGLYFRREDAVASTVLIWNWKSGALLAVIDNPASLTIRDFNFISQTAFLVTVVVRRGPFEDEKECIEEISIRLYHLGSHPSSYSLASPALIMYLPSVAESPFPGGRSFYFDFTAHSGPFTTMASPNRPFLVSESSRIHVFDLEVKSPVDGYSVDGLLVRLVVQQKTFLSLLNSCPRSGETRSLAWEEWGPPNTRLYEHGRGPHNPRRFSCSSVLAEFLPERLKISRIADFNVEASKGWELVTEPTILRRPRVFAKPVMTSLPYRQVVIPT